MVNYSQWFTDSQINSKLIYQELSTEITEKVENNLSVKEIINWITEQTKQAFNNQYSQFPQVGALNNCKGRWHEFLATTSLSEITFNINQQNNNCVAVFALPVSRSNKNNSSETSSKFLSLFINNNVTNGGHLDKITLWQNQIFLPSPDYTALSTLMRYNLICRDPPWRVSTRYTVRDYNENCCIIVALDNRNDYDYIQNMLQQQAKNPDSLLLYDFFKGKLTVENIKAAVSLKISNRSDRRYQPLFEAAMIKAMGYLLKQNWQYYMVVDELSSADRTIFSHAIAPHGIAIEQNFPLVDGTFLYRTKVDLIPLIERFSQQMSLP